MEAKKEELEEEEEASRSCEKKKENSHMEILNHRVMRQATYSLQKTPEHVLPSSSSLPLHTKRYIYYERIFKGRINYLTKHRGGWRGGGGGTTKPLRVAIQSKRENWDWLVLTEIMLCG